MDWAQTSRVRRDPMSDLRPEQIIALVAPLVVIQPGLARLAGGRLTNWNSPGPTSPSADDLVGPHLPDQRFAKLVRRPYQPSADGTPPWRWSRTAGPIRTFTTRRSA